MERNVAGRDFVVGDVHGCFRTLEHALRQVRFDRDRDRLLSVGDLVNRGPHSHEALQWLASRRISQAVMGNHEAMVLEVLMDGQHLLFASWVAAIRDEELIRWIGALGDLPLALTVETPTGDVGIIHAGPVERDWERTVKGLDRAERGTIRTALIGGSGPSWHGRKAAPVNGARAVVTGHAPVREPWCDGHWWRIDTGAGIAGMDRLTSFGSIRSRWRRQSWTWCPTSEDADDEDIRRGPAGHEPCPAP